ncbi:thiamine-phosphate kinase [Rothia sp. AR01]|uniref:Thiamine-monophosphate kinase n=1 Tax=Rothia santali TaxID=2949643 RepID=A0A9X2HDF8_9MICC|nr:thiamine-phosphate kinase [Rothia santali]MCP3426255.1 thiamine-phosphate kinase [Rothia santali]
MSAPTVGEASEDELLTEIRAVIDEHNAAAAARAPGRTLLGPGDDCAVLDLTGGRTVLTTDTQTSGQDYLLEWPCGYRTRGFDLGWKSAAQNLADVAAMGAEPVSLVISLTLPPETPVAFVGEMARGYAAAVLALGAPGCSIAGGDLGSGGELSATVAALGLTRGEPVRRSGAREGASSRRRDRGPSGGRAGSAAGARTPPGSVRGDGDGALPRRRAGRPGGLPARPCPPLALGPAMAAAGARAMIDVSDGLLRDGGRVARASGVAIDLREEPLNALVDPLREAARRLGADPWEWVLGGGEDHGILACFPQGAPLPEGVVAIGSCRTLKQGAPPVSIEGRAREDLGWDHFAAEDRL